VTEQSDDHYVSQGTVDLYDKLEEAKRKHSEMLTKLEQVEAQEQAKQEELK
jgi:hypothetical protein